MPIRGPHFGVQKESRYLDWGCQKTIAHGPNPVADSFCTACELRMLFTTLKVVKNKEFATKIIYSLQNKYLLSGSLEKKFADP